MLNSKENKKKQTLNKLFSIIIDEIKLINPKAIIIYGSYGRNEGAWILDEKNIYPYNDFDIVIIDDSIKNLKYQKKLKESLKKKLNVKWIDLQFMNISYLKSLSNCTIFNYDLKYGSKVIYGDKNILQKIPLKANSKINIKDLEILFNTRLWTFYGSFKSFNNMKMKDARFFKYQMSKAVLASIDSFLIRNNYYDCSYDVKVKKYLQLSEENHKLVQWAMREKLNPSNEIMTNEDAKKLYNNVRKIFFNEFFLSMGIILKREIKSPKDILETRSLIRYKIKNYIKFFILNQKNIFKKNDLKDLELILAASSEEKNLYNFEPFFSKKIKSLDLNFKDFANLKEKTSNLRFNL